MPVVLRDNTPEAALAVIERLLNDPNPYNPEFERVELGPWASVHVYIPTTEEKSTISPPYMEAFLELQKQVYQLAAHAKTGVANAGMLSDGDRERLQIHVLVTGGSNDYLASLAKPLEAMLKEMIGKMTGKQAVIVILGIAALIAAPWSFSTWLEQQKTIKLEELKGKDHQAALEAIKFTTSEHSKAVTQIVDVLQKQGETGKRALEVIESTNQAFLKAAAQTPKSKINDVEITRQEAETLRATGRKKAETKIVIQQVQVVDINTSDPMELLVVIMDPATRVQYRFKFKDNILAGLDRHKLFDSLENRAPIWAELAMKILDDEVRSVQFLRATEPPPEALAETDQ